MAAKRKITFNKGNKDTVSSEGKTGSVRKDIKNKFRSAEREEKPVKGTGKTGMKRNLSAKPTRKYSASGTSNQQNRATNKTQQHAPEQSRDTTRLNKYIANAGICSRREADKLIAEGRIKVNDAVVTEMGFQVKEGDKVYFNQKLLKKENHNYILLNKPKDYITTTDDPQGRKTVMELVKNACNERIYPVGRLDRNTTGLLLFTNDGDLAKKLSHPSYEIKKIYQVDLDKPITQEHLDQIQEGISLEDGPVEVDEIAVLSKDRTILGLEIHVGRNRIVRRIFEHLGYEVIRLDRMMFGPLTKKDLPRGNWRVLSDKEVILLKKFKQLKSPKSQRKSDSEV